MDKDEYLYLPVSLGEAIDKLTILDIKYNKISDNRINDIKKEYTLLYEKLCYFIDEYKSLYESMKKVNILIWDMMDILRDGNVDELTYLKTCKECIEYNDIRFRIKNKINLVSNSKLKEQKSYKINRLVVIIKCNIQRKDILINIIKYNSYIYDEIYILYDDNIDYIINNFNYDNTIIFKNDINYKIDYINKYELNNSENDLYKIFNIDKSNLEKFL
jgi:hypothetical protein